MLTALHLLLIPILWETTNGYSFPNNRPQVVCPMISHQGASNKRKLAHASAFVGQTSQRRSISLRISKDAAPIDFKISDDREKKELSWLVTTTGKLIGASSIPLGKLNKAMVVQTHRIMKAWSRRSSKPGSNAPYVVEQLLHRLIQEQHAGNPHAVVDTKTYNVVIEAWSKSREEGAAERTQEILQGMEKQFQKGDLKVKPNRESYSSLIKSWVRNTSGKKAANKVESIIQKMQELSQGDKEFLPPNRRSYNLLLFTYAHCSLPDAGERAEKILRGMLAAANDCAYSPDINSYNLVIKSWGRGNAEGFEYRAQSIFDEIMILPPASKITPNFETFAALFSCWLKSERHDALERIMSLLQIMEDLYHDGNTEAKPDLITMNSVLTALSRFRQFDDYERMLRLKSHMEKVYKVIPDTISHNILIDALSKSGRGDAPDKALGILSQMEGELRAGNTMVKPDNYSYTSVVDCITKADRPQAGKEALKVLDRMKQLHHEYGGNEPSTELYNAVLNALARTRSTENASVAFQLLEEMEEKGLPDRVTYSTILKSCRNGHEEYVLKAENMLARMAELGKQDTSLAPDSYTYTAVINVLSRSVASNKAERVLEILKEMIASYENGDNTSAPTVHVFNSALNACAFSHHHERAKMDAFVITVSILVMLQKYVSPNEVTYGTVLRACSNLLPRNDNRRDELVSKVFDKASKEGFVSEMVLRQLYFAASPDLFAQLIGMNRELQITLQDLPPEWRRNVKEQAAS